MSAINIASQTSKHIAQRGSQTYLPLLVLFLGSAGAYTYMIARQEGNAIDRARSRFLQAKDANDLRISGGAKIQHGDVLAARLPESYHGIGDLGLWSDKKRFGIDKVERHEPWANQK